MQLSFLGRTYTTSFPTVEVLETQETATFLGRPYQVKQCNVTQRQRPAESLIFMGRRYTH
jgi:hypothetical protein